MFANPPGLLRIEPHSEGLRDADLVGRRQPETAEWTAEQGMNLMSSTLLTEDTGVPFHQLQAEQIERFRKAWADAGHTREPRVSVSRSIFPIVDRPDRAYFGSETRSQDQVGILDGGVARFGKTYAGEPDQLVAGAAAGRGDRRGRHAAADRPEPARCRLQRAPARVAADARRAGARLALGPGVRVPVGARAVEGVRRERPISLPARP